MISGEKANKHAIYEVGLSNEDAGDFLSEWCDESGTSLDFSREFFGCHKSVTEIE